MAPRANWKGFFGKALGLTEDLIKLKCGHGAW
jgi:hypothetical protein